MEERAAPDGANEVGETPASANADELARVHRFRDDLGMFWRRLRTKRADHKLTPSQLQALGHLRRDGAMTAARLAASEQVTQQSIARTLASLQKESMITLGADPSDARASLVSITDHGLWMLAEDSARRSQWLAELLERECTEHERELLFLAGRILGRLAAPSEPDGARPRTPSPSPDDRQ